MQAFIFDANFFINLYKIDHLNSIEKLQHAFMDAGLNAGQVFTTDVVFKELKSLSQKSLEILKRILNIIHIPSRDIRQLTSNKDPRKNPQDPDLSLVVLGLKLHQKNPKQSNITIVTNDFKLNNFIRMHAPKIRTLPPSSFILHLLNDLKDRELLRYFKKIRQQIMWECEVQYVMERRDTYNPREKLRWLVEKALTVAKPSAIITEMDEEEAQKDSLKRLRYLINRFLKGERLSKNQNQAIKEYIPFLNAVKKANKKLRKVVSYLESDRFQEIIKQFREISTYLLATLQKAKVQLDSDKSPVLIELIAAYLARFEFFSAISLIEIDRQVALEHFDKVLTYSILANQVQNLLVINYFKALTIFFNSGGEQDYKEAGDQFNLTQELAKAQKNLRYFMLARFGEAISRYLSGEGQLALDIMTDVNKLVEKHLDISLDLWIEFGDNFYMIGMAGIAASLYREALEIAVQLERSETIDKILERLKRCLLATGSYVPSTIIKLEQFIDLAHDQDADSTSYNEAIARIAELNKQLHEEFQHFTGGRWVYGNELHESLLGPFDVINHKISEETIGKKQVAETTFFCYSDKHGGLAI
ncbi:MAG: hypothetical protein ACXQS8_03670, partial [Candidatus Helarchaeales archaeon]